MLLSAFSCNPYKGSESAVGWHWALKLSLMGYGVHVFTRHTGKKDIQRHHQLLNVTFHYIKLPLFLEKLYKLSAPTMYIYYILWQWKAYRVADKLKKRTNIYRVHHVSWGSIQQGSFMYKLKIPLLFGPAGGGQRAPIALKKYYGSHWRSEQKRELISRVMLKFNPACKQMLLRATAVLVSNQETAEFARNAGAKHVFPVLDVGINKEFFPLQPIHRTPSKNNFKLLWVGRMMPRKGIMLILDVMNSLKKFPGITLSIVGDGEMRKEAEAYCIALGLSERVFFIGSVPYNEVSNYYLSHDLFFYTSLRESGGVQLIEAMAYNLPVVTLDLHGPGQIVTEHTGIKVAVVNSEQVVRDLANAILFLVENKQPYQEMSSAARAFAEKQIWNNKIAEIVEKFY